MTVPAIVPELAAAVRVSAFRAEAYAFWGEAALSVRLTTSAAAANAAAAVRPMKRRRLSSRGSLRRVGTGVAVM